MATQAQLDNLKKITESFKKIDQEKLLRSSMGEESLKIDFGPKLLEINQKIEFALQYANRVNDSVITSVASIFESMRQAMDAQAQRSNADYVAQRPAFINNITQQLEQLLQHWPPLVTSAIENRGFLEDEGIRKEYQKTVESIKENSEAALKLVKEEAKKTIEEAKELAKQIEERARKTAAHISVEAAQEQFRAAQEDHKKNVKTWSVLSILSILTFIGIAVYLMQVQFPEEWKWHILYYTAIRITVLTAVGAVATFCLRILRAHLHMSQHNLHRQRIANSMAAFVESAVTPEQRDLILAQLIDSVASFGSSGLLQKEDDNIHSAKMTIDNIMRTLTPQSAK